MPSLPALAEEKRCSPVPFNVYHSLIVTAYYYDHGIHFTVKKAGQKQNKMIKKGSMLLLQKNYRSSWQKNDEIWLEGCPDVAFLKSSNCKKKEKQTWLLQRLPKKEMKNEDVGLL